MNASAALRHILALLALTASPAAAQSAPSPRQSDRQSMSDAWWTGPLLAPAAGTLPKGHVLIEPYVYDVITQGFYNSTGTRVSAPHANDVGSLTYFNYGLFNKFTIGAIPTFGYNRVSNNDSQGLNSSSVQFGDLEVQAQYRLRLFHEGSWLPTMSINVQETLPTGKYDQLGDRPANGLGSGAYTTTLGLYTQTFFWMPNGRILRARFNVTQAFSHSMNVEDVSVYGTAQGFRGHASPGAALFLDLAAEYSITRHWVFAADAVYRHQYNTAVSGYNLNDSAASIFLNSGSSQVFGLAPAFEYNFTSKVGLIAGARIFPAGKNTTDSITPVIAVNIVH